MNDTDKKRILVIEDDFHIAEGISLNLSLQGYEVKVAQDGVSGLTHWKNWHPDLVVLDIMLPEIDGLSVLRQIRMEDEKLPILILSAKSASDDKIKGLAYGVDDYLAKPFNLDEFLLRIERLLTRSSWYQEDQGEGGATNGMTSPYTFGDNEIDFSTFTAIGHKGEILLTEQEVKLLRLFIANRGKPLSRETILKIGWGYTSDDISTRTVDNFIVRFRKYFERNPKKPVYFKSLRSVGYIFDHD